VIQAAEMSVESGGRLTVDLAAVRANYGQLAARVAPARLGAVVKADAYGLGAIQVATALSAAGCSDFFVALLQEALPLKPQLPTSASVYVLNGLAPGDEAFCARSGVQPVLNSLGQALRWRDLARAQGRALAAAVQIDSGMSRLGLAPVEVDALLGEPDFQEHVDVTLLMTHLACAETPGAGVNRRQLDRFTSLADRFGPRARRSIANSAGSFLPPEFHGDLVRSGLALFGVEPTSAAGGMLRSVVRLEARVSQVRAVEAGAGVGYGMTFTTKAASRLATLAVGYADGWPRRLGGQAAAWFDGMRLPIVGRVSMDSMTVDATGLPPDALFEGDYVELIGPHADLDTVARQAETIPYEIMTGMGARLARRYIDVDAAGGELPA
jgi:alanine racemase